MLPSKAGPVDAKLRQCHNFHLQDKYSTQFYKSQEKFIYFLKFFQLENVWEQMMFSKQKSRNNLPLLLKTFRTEFSS